MHPFRTTACALLIALLVSGCRKEIAPAASEPTASKPTASKPTASKPPVSKPAKGIPGLKGCDLVTIEEAAKIVALEMVPFEPEDDRCTYNTKQPGGCTTIDIMPAAVAKLAQGKNALIPGLGDGAFLLLDMPTSAVLQAWKGETGLTISVSLTVNKPAGADLPAMAQQIAELALSRLP